MNYETISPARVCCCVCNVGWVVHCSAVMLCLVVCEFWSKPTSCWLRHVFKFNSSQISILIWAFYDSFFLNRSALSICLFEPSHSMDKDLIVGSAKRFYIFCLKN